MIMMDLTALVAGSSIPNTCGFGALGSNGLNQGAWININFIVVLLTIMVAVLVYTIAILLPAATREKLRGAAKVEAGQGIIGLVIVMLLVLFSAGTCQLGQGLTLGLSAGTYQNPQQFSQYYLENLLFVKNPELFGQLYSAGAQFLIFGNVLDQIVESVELSVGGYAGIQLDSNIVQVYYGYAGIATGTYTAMLVASYGVLFVFFLLLPIIFAFALTTLAPLALVLRSLPFGGPRLRETADAFLGIAIAFYFILPLTLTLDNYIINWTYCSTGVGNIAPPIGTVATGCNPYASYLAPGGNILAKLGDLNTILSSTPPSGSAKGLGSTGIQGEFFGGVVNGGGGIMSIMGNILKNLFDIPQVISGYGNEIAAFMFESIVLIALDIAITIGFAQGIAKGLDAFPRVIGVSPFWGNV